MIEGLGSQSGRTQKKIVISECGEVQKWEFQTIHSFFCFTHYPTAQIVHLVFTTGRFFVLPTKFDRSLIIKPRTVITDNASSFFLKLLLWYTQRIDVVLSIHSWWAYLLQMCQRETIVLTESILNLDLSIHSHSFIFALELDQLLSAVASQNKGCFVLVHSQQRRNCVLIWVETKQRSNVIRCIVHCVSSRLLSSGCFSLR
jgi:hypothetical protein